MNKTQKVGRLSFVLLLAVFTACSNNMVELRRNYAAAESTTTSSMPTIISNSSPNFSKITMSNRLVGWGISDGKLFRTSDGGRSWEMQYAPEDQRTELGNYRFRQEAETVQAMSESEAWFSTSDSMAHTVDCGKSWSTVKFDDAIIRSFNFQDTSNGWIVGEKRSSSENGPEWLAYAAATENGGKSWSEIKLGMAAKAGTTVFDLSVWKNWIRLVTGDAFLQSSNNGRSWQRLEPDCDFWGTLSNISFFDENNGFVRSNQGSNFCVSKDGGKSWQSRQLPEIHGGVAAIVQTGPNDYWAAGDEGVFRSLDDAKSWLNVASGKFATFQYLPKENLLIAAGDQIISLELPDSTSVLR